MPQTSRKYIFNPWKLDIELNQVVSIFYMYHTITAQIMANMQKTI